MKDYNIYLQKAHRFIVKEVLSDVAKTGLEDETALFISFQTDRKDVIIPDFVRAQYPKEIGIILQYQFSNLNVTDEYFSVDLAFGGVSSTIQVPFIALLQFVDKTSGFGFELTPIPATKEKEEEITTFDNVDVIDLDRFRKK